MSLYINIQEILPIVYNTKPLIMKEFTSASITKKGAADFVTTIDFAVQEYLKKILMTKYPHIRFISEEQDSKENILLRDHAAWILDPIDGTTNLIRDCKMSAVSLGLYQNGRMELGIVFNPFSSETYYAALGQGAFMNDKPIHVFNNTNLEDCIINIGTSPYEKEYAAQNFKAFEKVFMECADIRRSGSAALDLCYVASGRTDAYFERNLKPWDFAAGHLILCEAGGVAYTFDGSEIIHGQISDVCAGNPAIVNLLLPYLNS